MKHGKRPTRDQKKLLRAMGMEAADWLISENTPEKLVLVHRHLDKHRTIDKAYIATILNEKTSSFKKGRRSDC